MMKHKQLLLNFVGIKSSEHSGIRKTIGIDNTNIYLQRNYFKLSTRLGA